MLTGRLSDLVKTIENGARLTAALTALRSERRKDPNFQGCDFCFDTAYGELEDGTTVPCPEHNGLCCC